MTEARPYPSTQPSMLSLTRFQMWFTCLLPGDVTPPTTPQDSRCPGRLRPGCNPPAALLHVAYAVYGARFDFFSTAYRRSKHSRVHRSMLEAGRSSARFGISISHWRSEHQSCPAHCTNALLIHQQRWRDILIIGGCHVNVMYIDRLGPIG